MGHPIRRQRRRAILAPVVTARCGVADHRVSPLPAFLPIPQDGRAHAAARPTSPPQSPIANRTPANVDPNSEIPPRSRSPNTSTCFRKSPTSVRRKR